MNGAGLGTPFSGQRPTFEALLSRDDGRPAGTAWGVFGTDDEVGTVNLLTPERVLDAVTCVRTGEVYPLNMRFDEPAPNPWRRRPHRVQLAPSDYTRDDYIEGLHLQYSTQWDGLRHVGLNGGFYNGVTPDEIDEPGSITLGIHQWAQRGITGRGVLLDVARHAEAHGIRMDPGEKYDIGPELLDTVIAAQSSPLRPGDIVLVRTGWLGWYEGLTAEVAAVSQTVDMRQPGLAATDQMAAWLWDRTVSAVVTDNCAVESMPMPPAPHRLHNRLIAGLGMPLGELFVLDLLARACAEDGRYTFLFASAPFNVPGGVGSPGNALAIR